MLSELESRIEACRTNIQHWESEIDKAKSNIKSENKKIKELEKIQNKLADLYV